MDKISVQDRISLVRCFYQCGNSVVSALRQFNKENNRKTNVCSEGSVRHLIKRFEEVGSVADLSRSGRPRVSEEDVEKVAEATVSLQSAHPLGIASSKNVSTQIGMPQSTVKKCSVSISTGVLTTFTWCNN